MNGKKEFGDYQTPIDFTNKICNLLLKYKKIHPKTIIEPTCGIGNFLISAQIFNADNYYGIEVNKKYCEKARKNINNNNVQIFNADFFKYDLIKLNQAGPVLILGNPPWVTNSDLSKIDAKNLPNKKNIKQLNGIEALTGLSNFDICEYMILKVIEQFQNTNTTIAMLCKTSVARNVYQELFRRNIDFIDFNMYEFDAKKVFDVSTDACMLYIQLTNKNNKKCNCDIYDINNCIKPIKTFGYKNGKIYSDLSATNEIELFDGKCCFEWRQGIKHDCSKTMELKKDNKRYINGFDEEVKIEDTLVYPLVKSSMFKNPIIDCYSKYVIVTQKKVKEDTSYIQTTAPKTWNYLQKHLEYFNNRKSSIYKNSPVFSMFGVGDYSYSKYKVGISGFYKKPLFSLIYSDDKPVMVDDTGYFICFESYKDAYVAMLLLNSKKVQKFIESISFKDSKRPYTKKVLERLDFNSICENITFEEIEKTEKSLGLDKLISKQDYQSFKSMVNTVV